MRISASRAPKPSFITLPLMAGTFPCLLDFFDARFPRVGREVWRQRLQQGLVRDEQGRPVDESTPYRVNARLSYYREVEREPVIPFDACIVYEDDDILVADKPHFLPVTPSGHYVNECLLHRLVNSSGNDELVAVHRLDRETAGLVLFSKRKTTRESWFALFRKATIDKRYEAVARLDAIPAQREWQVQNRIGYGAHRPLYANLSGEPNARSCIRLLGVHDGLGYFELQPLSGKTHQLRLHMLLLGMPLLGDRLYPEFRPASGEPDYTSPLQLLARSLAFTDPRSGGLRRFESGLQLSAWSAGTSCNISPYGSSADKL